jgi:hypothetical protein
MRIMATVGIILRRMIKNTKILGHDTRYLHDKRLERHCYVNIFGLEFGKRHCKILVEIGNRDKYSVFSSVIQTDDAFK